VLIAGPPALGCSWLDMSIVFVFFLLMRPLDSHRRLDGRVMLIVDDLEIFEGVVE
jgi:hypothetical protein